MDKSKDSFNCPHCQLKNHSDEIAKLKSTINSLTETVNSLQSLLTQTLEQPVASKEAVVSLTDQSETSRPLINHIPKPAVPNGILPSERRFNVIVHGVKESPPDTPRYQRQKQDLDESLAILNTLNNEINSYSVRDCFRLGKFKKQTNRPRPIMVKLNRAVDVTTILSNRNLTPKGISVKPDLNQEERQRESLLLGERWRLIQSGVDKKLIKIRSSTIYVQGRKHGQVVNNSIQYHNKPDNSNPTQTSTQANPPVIIPPENRFNPDAPSDHSN